MRLLYFGDMTVVYWAEENSGAYQGLLNEMLFGAADDDDENSVMTDAALNAIIQSVKDLQPIKFADIDIDYDNDFYILGLSPNAARLSVRLFLRSKFGAVMKNVARHIDDLAIVHPSYKKAHIPLWKILRATVNLNNKDKAASPVMSGAVLRSILTGANYPASLFQNVLMRIRAERDDKDNKRYKITYERAAIIKAYLLRNKKRSENFMALDEKNNSPAYVLGRVFAVWEHIQDEANPGLNATIKDRYFDSMCATPAKIFPILQKLSNHHLRKLKDNIGLKTKFNKKLTDLLGRLNPEDMPGVLSPEEQGVFILGYYHEVRARYAKKEDKNNE